MKGKRLALLPDSGPSIESRVVAGLHKIGLAMKQQAWQQANGAGLSPTQAQILALAVAHEPLTGTDLSERLGLSLPTISDSVRVLVQKKLLRKKPDPRHPRASLLTLTGRGRQLGTKARAWPEFMADAVGQLSPEEQRAFSSGILKMIVALQGQGLIPLDGMCLSCSHFRPNVHTGAKPHHCALIDAPLAGEELRLDCPDQALANSEVRQQLWEQFTRPQP
jgi:DNA-binding MarR family transcriptional regulator